MATQADIDGLVRRFRDVDAALARLGDREVTYSTQTRTRTEPASAARARVQESVASLQAMDYSAITSENVTQLHEWIDRLEHEVSSTGVGLLALLTGIVALGAAALLVA